jgi:hypothetical protein
MNNWNRGLIILLSAIGLALVAGAFTTAGGICRVYSDTLMCVVETGRLWSNYNGQGGLMPYAWVFSVAVVLGLIGAFFMSRRA